MSDTEKANVSRQRHRRNTPKLTAQIYMDGSTWTAVDPSEARKSLASGDEFEIEEVISITDLDLPGRVFELPTTDPAKSVLLLPVI